MSVTTPPGAPATALNPASPASASGGSGLRVHGSAGRRSLTLLAGLLGLLLLAQGGIGLYFALRVRGDFQTITHDSVPSIVAAQNLRADAQSMDADLSNTILEDGNPGPSTRKEDWAALRSADARKVDDDIARAQANITFAGECQAVAALRSGFIGYSTFAAQAELQARAAGGALGDPSNPAAVASYARAATVFQTSIEPGTVAGDTDSGVNVPAGAPAPLQSCDSEAQPGVSSAGGLFTINSEHETSAYTAGRSAIGASIAVAIVVGLMLLAGAAMLNQLLGQRTHRRINPGVAGASAAIVLLTLLSVLVFRSLSGSFKVVSKDSLDSVKYALDIVSTANAGNADESRWLFDSQNKSTWQSDFFTQAGIVDQLIVRARCNITFPGEAEAIDGIGKGQAPADCKNPPAQAVCQGQSLCASWQKYRAIDTQIRQQENAGQHLQAVQTDLGISNDAYYQFTKMAAQLQKVNQDVYSRTAADAERTALTLAIACAGIALAGAVLLLVGMRPRLAEL